jgi:superoxide dismutase
MANEAKDQKYPFELPALEYDYDALEPVIMSKQ